MFRTKLWEKTINFYWNNRFIEKTSLMNVRSLKKKNKIYGTWTIILTINKIKNERNEKSPSHPSLCTNVWTKLLVFSNLCSFKNFQEFFIYKWETLIGFVQRGNFLISVLSERISMNITLTVFKLSFITS